MMSRDPIFAPVLLQGGLTLATYLLLMRARFRAYRANQVDKARFPLHADAWPDDARKIANDVRNQFELPVLFYVTALTLWALHAVHYMALAAAWLFVASRVVHMRIHLGSKDVTARFKAFAFGWAMVAVMIWLALWELGRRAVGVGPF